MRLKQANEVDLGQTSVGRLLFVLAVPAITSQVVNALYNMVDRMYIGHIPGEGAAALTGVGICFPIIMIVSAFAYLMGMGGAPRASIFMGKQDNITAEKILGNCFSALLMTAAVLTAVVLMFKEPLLLLFGASENTIDYAQQYITIYALGTVFVQATLGLNAFISAQGFAKISMMTVVIGAVTNIVLDPIFIFGLHMGVRGAATATVISQAISALWAYRFLRGKKTVLRLKREYLKPEKSILLPCVALGIAPFVMMSTESLLTLCFNTSLLKYGGDIAVGSMTILSSVMQFSMLPMQGVSCFVYAAIIWLLAELVPSVFAGIFTDDPQLVEFTTWALRIYMATSLLMGLQISCQQSFIAFGNAKISAFLAIFRKIIVLIPLIFLLPVFFMDKVFAVFLAEPVADAIAVAATVTLFLREMRRMLRDDPEN